jgi:hypothetical protein
MSYSSKAVSTGLGLRAELTTAELEEMLRQAHRRYNDLRRAILTLDASLAAQEVQLARSPKSTAVTARERAVASGARRLQLGATRRAIDSLLRSA